MKFLVKALVFVITGGFYPSFVTDIEDRLQELEIDYRIEENLDSRYSKNGIWAVYDHDEDMIVFNGKRFRGSAERWLPVVVHEIVHKVRSENGLWTNDRLEELIACYATPKANEILKFGNIDENLDRWARRTLKANNLPDHRITPDEASKLAIELPKTLRLIELTYGSKEK
jgi:hypothetical protein